MILDDNLLYIISIGFSLILSIFGLRKEFRYSKMFRLLYLFLLPVAAVIIERCGPSMYLILLYIGIAMVSFCYFLGDDKKKQRSVICAIACVLMIIGLAFNSIKPDFREKDDYVKEYNKVFEQLKQYYVLGAHKNIDWDELYDEYLPMFEEAAEQNDAGMAYEAWRSFTRSFHDGHVYISMVSDNETCEEQYARKHSGNDYGFSLVSLSDGSVVFVNVDKDSEAYEKGVRDFYRIASFDGKDIDALIKESFVYFYEFPDAANEEFFKPVFATANSGEQVTLTYIDADNRECDITINSKGDNYERSKRTVEQLLCGCNTASAAVNNNLSVRMVSEDTGCLVINQMDIDEHIRFGSEESEEYSGLSKMVKKQIEELKKQGATKLIIDMRGNYGGYLQASIELASFFTDEEMFAAAEGEAIEHTNTYRCVTSLNVKPDNIWGDGPIVILVNAETISAGELFIHMMMQLDNVTVMGFTKSCGSAMGVTSITTDTIELTYPELLLLDSEGKVLIDAGADRVMGMTPDILIPFDEAACRSIFEKNEDYVMDYAISYLH